MAEEKGEKQEGTGIKVGFGLNGFLDQLTSLAEASGDAGAQERVATLRERLGALSGGGEEGKPQQEPQVDSGLNFNIGGLDLAGLVGGLVGGDTKGKGAGTGLNLGLDGIFGAVGKITEAAAKLQQAQGNLGGSFREINIGGRRGVISIGGNIGSVQDLISGQETESSDFNPEPVVSRAERSSKAAATVVAAPSEESARFNLEVTEVGNSLMVFGTVPAVENENEIGCAVSDDGAKLLVTVKDATQEVRLPSGVEPGEAKASYTNGLFSVTLKKAR